MPALFPLVMEHASAMLGILEILGDKAAALRSAMGVGVQFIRTAL